MYDGKMRLGHSKELNQKTKGVVKQMRKRRLESYEYLPRMDINSITKRIFKRRKTEPIWFRELKVDLSKMGVTKEHIANRDRISQVKEQEFSKKGEDPEKTQISYTEKQKKEVSEIMKIYWQKVKGERAKHKECQAWFIDAQNKTNLMSNI